MNSNEIRSRFLDFFKRKSHDIVESAPMVIKNDPTLMFTNAGMNQFKDLFLGNSEIKSPRVANSQKCLRVSGKHNDLEEVGVDTYHHTMFEMLGNWSFGNYFKEEAIEWGWEFLTKELKLNPDLLYVTIFEGGDGLDKDQEAYDFWKKWIPEDRILNGDKKDNFWEMGAQGPCGPCSEIHIDLRSEEEKAKVDGKSLVNQDHPQVVEIWNLVFMQYNRLADESLEPLPAQHVDTGMGLERLCMAMQHKESNYDTDIFSGYIDFLSKLSGVKYEHSDSKTDVALRVISDHVRAVAFSITDGQLPSNTGAGYVIRRILRRAIRYGYSFLGFKEAFIYKLVPLLVEKMSGNFTELKAQETLIGKVIKEEEESFLRALERGIQRFDSYVSEGKKEIDGKFAFELYDTFGFPIDLTCLMASEKGINVDMDGFKKHLKIQKDTARQANKIDTEDWVALGEGEGTFIGYDQLEGSSKILRYRKASIKGKDLFQVEVAETPFYAEGGGQVGDTGYFEQNGEKYSVKDTKKENGVILHFMDKLPVDPAAEIKLVVSGRNRKATECNHSATHLLHYALRKVLGTHVEQKGSLVNEKALRFDFSHFGKMTDEELRQVEDEVNKMIAQNISLEERREASMDEAKEMGAMALFGEKYGDVVRVIRFGESTELCGGTHVSSTASIGRMILLSEGAVAAGVRRVEAITGEKANEYIRKKMDLLDEINGLLKSPKDLKKAVEQLVTQNQSLQKEVESLVREKAGGLKKDLIAAVENIEGVSFLAREIQLDAPEAIKDLAFQMKNEVPNLFLVLGANVKGKPNLTVMIDEELVKSKGYNAGQIVRELAKEIKGGGGGQPFYATAGGKDIEGIPSAIGKAREYVK